MFGWQYCWILGPVTTNKEMETSSYNLRVSNSVLFPTGLPDELSWAGRHFCDTVNPTMPCPTSEQQKQDINGQEE